ncbi:DUF115 domain-containing protein [Bacteroidales bacterium OttesenSCG-928-L03]|nr:DUF115 domain-containing protein [Bacteroidales bacterium OttesenSCG-928-L03]
MIYDQILDDMDYDRSSDESSAKLLKALTLNSNIIDEDDLQIEKIVTVFGNGPNLEKDVSLSKPEGTLISSGSAVERLLRMDIVPHIIVTDLDGEIEPQIRCNKEGVITFIHAHGDNVDLIQKYVHEFTGPIIITTQSIPDNKVLNFGGFTDGDRAVCIARHFGARNILLLGFDFDDPMTKKGMDPKVKLKKLQWARKIIFDNNEAGIEIKLPIDIL